MRQRILVGMALILALGVAISIPLRMGKGADILKLESVTRAYREYEFKRFTRIENTAEDAISTYDLTAEVEFSGREAPSARGYLSMLRMKRARQLINGSVDDTFSPAREINRIADPRNRLILQGRPDLYTLENLSEPEFFPLLSGVRSKPGDSWEYQFRVRIPNQNQAMIVIARTYFDDYDYRDNERVARLRHEVDGESLYAAAEGGIDKAVLRVRGIANWSVTRSALHSAEQRLEFSIYDFNAIRGASSGTLTAATGRRLFWTTDMTVKLLRKTDVMETPRATPRAAQDEFEAL